MLIRIPTPNDVFGLAKSTVGWAVSSATTVASVPARLFGALDGMEALLARVTEIVDRADALVARTEGTVDQVDVLLERVGIAAAQASAAIEVVNRITRSAEELVGNVGDVSQQASATVVSAQRTAAAADELLTVYQPIAHKAAPMAERFVSELSPNEVDAAIRLVDELPVLTEHMVTDIMPILRTLDRVGPEIHELLEVTHDVRRAIVGIPGFRFFRRRGEDRVTGEEQDAAVPPHYDRPPSSGDGRSAQG